jgi:hypothetical protein
LREWRHVIGERFFESRPGLAALAVRFEIGEALQHIAMRSMRSTVVIIRSPAVKRSSSWSRSPNLSESFASRASVISVCAGLRNFAYSSPA